VRATTASRYRCSNSRSCVSCVRMALSSISESPLLIRTFNSASAASRMASSRATMAAASASASLAASSTASRASNRSHPMTVCENAAGCIATMALISFCRKKQVAKKSSRSNPSMAVTWLRASSPFANTRSPPGASNCTTVAPPRVRLCSIATPLSNVSRTRPMSVPSVIQSSTPLRAGGLP